MCVCATVAIESAKVLSRPQSGMRMKLARVKGLQDNEMWLDAR